MGGGNVSYRCLRFLHSKTSLLIVFRFLLCLLELLVVKQEVKLEKKQHIGKKASELFSGKETFYLPSV